MGLRFRKSFKLAPGIRLNVGSGGTSWSIGPRGATVNIGKRGTYLNASLPGTGFSSRTRLDGPAKESASAPAQPVTVSLNLELGDDGVLRYLGADGRPVSSEMVALARRQHGDTIRSMLARHCERTGAEIAALAELHWATPAPVRPGRFVSAPFDAIPPVSPLPLVLGLTDRFLPGRRQAAEAAQVEREKAYREDIGRYEIAKAAHDARNTEDRMAYSAAIAGNPQPMQRLLERQLGDIQWPKETMVEVAVDDNGSRLTLDVDLPEIEHMPGQRVTVAARALDITYKDAGEVATRKLYRQHIHALGFRMIGETFAALPTVQCIIFSGYSQRLDRSNGYTTDEYLYSVRIVRDQWAALNFDALRQIDASEALGKFEIRRDMTATGIFRPIVPLAYAG